MYKRLFSWLCFAILLPTLAFAGGGSPAPVPPLPPAPVPPVALPMRPFMLAAANPFGEPTPSGPTGIDQVSVHIFDNVNNAIRINASFTGGAGPFTPTSADQVFSSIFDSTNNAIFVNCIVGCSGGGGPATAITFGATTQNSNSTAATGAGQCLVSSGTGPYTFGFGSCSGSASTNFTALVNNGANTGQGTFAVGTGSAFASTGTGTITANQFQSGAGTAAAISFSGLVNGQTVDYNGTNWVNAYNFANPTFSNSGSASGQEIWVCPSLTAVGQACPYSTLAAAMSAVQTAGSAATIHDENCSETVSSNVFSVSSTQNPPITIYAPKCKGAPWLIANYPQALRNSNIRIIGQGGASTAASYSGTSIVAGPSFPLPVPQSPPATTATFTTSGCSSPSFANGFVADVIAAYDNAAGDTGENLAVEQTVTNSTGSNACLSVPEVTTGNANAIGWDVFVSPTNGSGSASELFAKHSTKGSGTVIINSPPTGGINGGVGLSYVNTTAAVFSVGVPQTIAPSNLINEIFDTRIQGGILIDCQGVPGSIGYVDFMGQELSGFQPDGSLFIRNCGGVNPTLGNLNSSSASNFVLNSVNYSCSSSNLCFQNNARAAIMGNTNTLGGNNSDFENFDFPDSSCSSGNPCNGATTSGFTPPNTCGSSTTITCAVQATYEVVADNVQGLRSIGNGTATPNTASTLNTNQGLAVILGTPGNNSWQTVRMHDLHYEGPQSATAPATLGTCEVTVQAAAGVYEHINGTTTNNMAVGCNDAQSFGLFAADISPSSLGTRWAWTDSLNSINATQLPKGVRIPFFGLGDKANSYIYGPFFASFFPANNSTAVALSATCDNSGSSDCFDVYKNSGSNTRGTKVLSVTSAGVLNLNTPLAIANGGTGTATPNLVAGTNVTITGTWPNQTINSSGGGGSLTSTFIGYGSSGNALTGDSSHTLNSNGTVLLSPGTSNDDPALQLVQTNTSPASDIFQVYTHGATPTNTCSTNAQCVFAIQANGNEYFAGNNATYGASNQSTQSFLRLYGSVSGGSNVAPPYMQFFSGNASFQTDLFSSISVSGVLCVGSTVPGGDCGAGQQVMLNPMTTAGDLIYGGSVALGTAAPTRLGIGANGTVLASNGSNPAWDTLSTAGIMSNSFPTTVVGGVSGGIPYFSSTTAMASTSLLAANAIVQGGGSGAAPTTGNADFTIDATAHTLKSDASGLVDFSPISSTTGFKVPSITSGTATANAVITFDSTATNYHGFANSADSIFGVVPTGTAVNGDCVNFAVVSGNVLLHDSGAGCGGGGGATALSAITAATTTNTLTNGNHGGQLWEWAQTTNSQTAFELADSAAATGTSDQLFNITTAANSTEVPETINQGTISNTTAVPVLNLTSTWNNVALVGQGIQFALINTTSSTSSTLLNLLAGSSGTTSKFSVGVGGNTTMAGNLNFSTANYQILDSSGSISSTVLITGADAASNAAGGLMTIRGCNETSTSAFTSAAGCPFLTTGGNNTATSTSSAAGGWEVGPGASTGTSNAGLQGLYSQFFAYVKGATVTQWNLQCFSAGMTTADCAASPGNWIGVAEVVNTNTVQVVASGQVAINAVSSPTATVGDTFCTSSTAGKGIDSGSTSACALGSQIGIVAAVSGTYKYPDGTSVTLSTTLPLIQIARD